MNAKLIVKALYAAFLLSIPALGYAQGLQAGTDMADEFRIWAYGFLGIAVVIYMLYKVFMALISKESWADVMQGLGYCAVAGGIMVAADFMWSIWGDSQVL